MPESYNCQNEVRAPVSMNTLTLSVLEPNPGTWPNGVIQYTKWFDDSLVWDFWGKTSWLDRYEEVHDCRVICDAEYRPIYLEFDSLEKLTEFTLKWL